MTARACDTCRHRIRWHRTPICTRPLSALGIPVERMRQHLYAVEPCDAERSAGRLMAIVTMSCGRSGRYWSPR